MIRQILEVFFLAQVVTEAVVEESEKALKNATDQLQDAFNTVKYETSNGNHRVEAAVKTTKKDYERVVNSVQDLVTNLWVLVQEYAKLPVSHVLNTLPGTTTHKTSKAAR